MEKTDLIFMALLITLTGGGAQATAAPADSAPATATHAGAGTPRANPGTLNGEIVETMNAAGYTYVLLNTDSGKIWAAATETSVKVGQRVSVPPGELMTDFSSKTLNRTFDKIYFVSGIYPEGALEKAADQGHGMGASSRTVVTDAHVEGVAKAEGGYTVEEILTRSSKLTGQKVKVRGRVVKFTADIMGTNWMHIQDGTPGDLTVTTDTLVAKGDLVMVEGTLSVNKDFGAGYVYPAIIEKAMVTKE
ncbi:MAG: hypothetical protein WAL92_11780 [Thiogranum sp.]